MKYGSLFTGVGGFDEGLDRAGMKGAWQVEINPWRRKVLSLHWPNVPKHSDIREVGKHNLAPVDLMCGGFPCQDLSVAGKRKGLEGDRSGLFYEFARLIGELQPAFLLIENVPGLLTSNGGRDFHIVLSTLDNLGYGLSWRVLDSRYFGVPQRRRRVYIVGCFGRVCPPSILFEPESGGGDIAEGEEAGEGTAREVAGVLRSGGCGGVPTSRGENLIPIATTLSTTNGGGRRRCDEENIIADTIRTREGASAFRGDGSDNIVAGTIDASINDKWGSNQWVDQNHWVVGPTAGTITARDYKGADNFCAEENKLVAGTIDTAPGRRYRCDDSDNLIVAGTLRGHGNGPIYQERVTYPLDTTVAQAVISESQHGQEIDANGMREVTGVSRRLDLPVREEPGTECLTPWDIQSERIKGVNGVMSTLGGVKTGGQKGLAVIVPSLSKSMAGISRPGGERTAGGAYYIVQKEHGAQSEGVCTCPDTPRYQAMGDAVTVWVIEWIGRRILAAIAEIEHREGEHEQV